MKKVINGRMYDTETATMLGKVTLGEPRNWDYHEEVLFKKRNGDYFFRLEGTVISSRRAALRLASMKSASVMRSFFCFFLGFIIPST